jgi:cytochrome c-type biogenesis protein CcmH
MSGKMPSGGGISARALLRFIPAMTLAGWLACCVPASAVEPDEILDDPVLEQRARALSAELRCPVCQGESIDESDAPLAKDLRILVRERLKAGADEQEIRAFLTARYGEFVMLKPAFNLRNLPLWLAPGLFVLLGGVLLLKHRARSRLPETVQPAEEHPGASPADRVD